MTPEEILEIANRDDVPVFVIDSKEIADWNRQHRDQQTGICTEYSGWYVVTHPSLNPAQRPTFHVLAQWVWGKCTPLSFDIPFVADPGHRLANQVTNRDIRLLALPAGAPMPLLVEIHGGRGFLVVTSEDDKLVGRPLKSGRRDAAIDEAGMSGISLQHCFDASINKFAPLEDADITSAVVPPEIATVPEHQAQGGFEP